MLVITTPSSQISPSFQARRSRCHLTTRQARSRHRRCLRLSYHRWGRLGSRTSLHIPYRLPTHLLTSSAPSHSSRPCRYSSYTKLLTQTFNSTPLRRSSLSELSPTADSFFREQPRLWVSFLPYSLQLGFYRRRIQHGRFAPDSSSPLSYCPSIC